MQRRGLVVDDEPLLCEMIGKVLNSAGMEALILPEARKLPIFSMKENLMSCFWIYTCPLPTGSNLPGRCAVRASIERHPSSRSATISVRVRFP